MILNSKHTIAFVLVILVFLPGCFGSNNNSPTEPPVDPPVDPPDDPPVDPPVDPPTLPCANGFNSFGDESIFTYEGFEDVENDDPSKRRTGWEWNGPTWKGLWVLY